MPQVTFVAPVAATTTAGLLAPVVETLPQSTVAVLTPSMKRPIELSPTVVMLAVLANVSGPLPVISTAVPVPVVEAPATVALIAPAPPASRRAFAPLATCLPPLKFIAPVELMTVPVAPASVAVTVPVARVTALVSALTVTPLPVVATLPMIRFTGAVEVITAPCDPAPVVVTLPRLPVTPAPVMTAAVTPAPFVCKVAPEPRRLIAPVDARSSALAVLAPAPTPEVVMLPYPASIVPVPARLNSPVEPIPVVVMTPAFTVTFPALVVLAVSPNAFAPAVVAEVMLTVILPPLENENTPLLPLPVVVSAPQLIVTLPVPVACAIIALELLPVVETVGQPETSTLPVVALNAEAKMPAPLTVEIAPVRTLTLPPKDCPATPKPPKSGPLFTVVTSPVVTETVPPLTSTPPPLATTLPETTVAFDVLPAITLIARPVVDRLPALILREPVCVACIPRLVAPVVVMLPVRSVRSVPPDESTPNELVPLVDTFPTVTVAAWPEVFNVTPFAPTPPVVRTSTGAAFVIGTKVSAPPVDVKLTARTPVVETGPVPLYSIVDGEVVFTVTRPGPGTVAVPGLAVADRTVVVPSVQVIIVPDCEHVVDWAKAVPGTAQAKMAVDTLLRSAKRAFELSILEASLLTLIHVFTPQIYPQLWQGFAMYPCVT